MMISLDWLREYVDIDLSAEELADRLTLAGLETETIEKVGDDTVIELETTSNRPDHLGHIGVAREVAWICKAPLRLPEDTLDTVADVDGRRLGDWIILDVHDAERCPRYTARLAVDVQVAPSPGWLQRRIEAIGLRPVNNVVDLSNYVLFEWGQPLHAFDYELLEGGTILVRRAAQGEEFTAINGHGYSLDREDLMIADAARSVALAGIMGGLNSEVHDGTTKVLVESAYFEPIGVRRSSRRLALSSDASYRFERRVDPRGVESASVRFCHLLQKHAGAKILAGSLDSVEQKFLDDARPIVPVRPARCTQVLGVDFDLNTVSRCLESIGFERAGGTDVEPQFRCPSYRSDVTREVDLVEEVARVYGFDNIPESELRVFPVHITDLERQVERTKAWMVAAGYHEALTYSFVERGEFIPLEEWWCEGDPYEVRNPVRSKERFLRRSLLPNLLAAVRGNRNHGIDEIALFEVSRVFHRKNGNTHPEEAVHLAWVRAGAGLDLRDARGVADGILSALHVDLRGQELGNWTPLTAAKGPLSGAGATLEAGGGRRLGIVGATGISAFKGEIWCGELAIGPLLEGAAESLPFQEFSRYPTIERDVNVVLDDATPWADIAAEVSDLELEDLVSVDFVDLYRGKQVPDGKKSVTFSLLFQSDSRTLTGEEADERTDRAVARLAERFAAERR